MKKNLPPKDCLGSRYKIVIYFFQDKAQKETRKHDFYSRFLGQKEPAHGFAYWQQRIYWYIDHAQYGIKWAAIYDNLNQDREKEPLLVILGNGTQLLNMPSL